MIVFPGSEHHFTGSLGIVAMTKLVLKEEGISGFYGGVTGVMIGQGQLSRTSTVFFTVL